MVEHLGLLSRSDESSSIIKDLPGAGLGGWWAGSGLKRGGPARLGCETPAVPREASQTVTGLSRADGFQPGECTQGIRSVDASYSTEIASI